MKDKIASAFPGHTSINSHSGSNLYIMDFQQRTSGQRSIEVSENSFNNDPDIVCNNERSNSLHVLNEQNVLLHFAKLEPNIFARGITNAEGCLFAEHTDTFILFVEIKDCKNTNLTEHANKAKQQIIDTVTEFKKQQIISGNHKVYAVISMPRRTKSSFDSHLFCSNIMTKEVFRQHKIIIAGTNRVKVVNETLIEHIY